LLADEGKGVDESGDFISFDYVVKTGHTGAGEPLLEGFLNLLNGAPLEAKLRYVIFRLKKLGCDGGISDAIARIRL